MTRPDFIATAATPLLAADLGFGDQALIRNPLR